MSFQSILDSIREDTDRTALKDMAAKYPSLREYADVGSKYANLSPRLRKLGGEVLEKDPEKMVAYAEEWRAWKDDNWDSDAGMTVQQRRKQELLEAAEARIAEFEARGESDMTAEEMEALAEKVAQRVMKASGVVTKAELDTAIEKEYAPKFLGETRNAIAGFESVMKELGPKFTNHARVYGEDLDVNKLFSHMDEAFKNGRRINATEAYNEVYADKISARNQELKAKEAADLKAEGAAEERKRLAAEGRPGAMPIGSSEGKRMGAFQRRALEKMRQADPAKEPPLGRGVIAARAAEERRNKEFAGAA